jgi:predicted amidohydrolase
MVKIAIAQTNPRLGDVSGNLARIEDLLAEAAGRGAKIAVFPECAATGYMYSSLREAREVAEAIPGRVSDGFDSAAARSGIFVLAGMLERDGDKVYNTAVLAGPAGIEAVYRKSHTLCLGVDRFTTPGDQPYRVHQLPFGRFGILICYDLRFPETARVLALEGAQAVLLPTNWPRSSSIQPDVFTRSRAAENRIFVIAANRVGEERGARFLGRSQVVGPDGDVLAEASDSDEQMMIVDVDLDQADIKHVVVEPGAHEMNLFEDRRPDMYEALVGDLRLAEIH